MTDRRLSWRARAREWSRRPRVRLLAFTSALVLFAVGLAVAWEAADLSLSDLDLTLMLAAAALVPLSIGGSTWLLTLLGRAAGASIRAWQALRVVTVGTLSGLAPLSSGSVVRGGALLYFGASVGAVGRTLGADALVWLTEGLLVSGGAALLLGARTPALLLLAGGAVGTAALLVIRRRSGASRLAGIGAARGVTTGVEVVRLYACFAVLGQPVGLLQAASLAAASPLAALLFFMPAGLGVREAFTAGMAAAVGIDAADAFIAATLNRLIGLSVLLLWEVGLLVTGRGAPLPGARGRADGRAPETRGP